MLRSNILATKKTVPILAMTGLSLLVDTGTVRVLKPVRTFAANLGKR